MQRELRLDAEDPLARARRYALVRETADSLGMIADFTTVTDQRGQR